MAVDRRDCDTNKKWSKSGQSVPTITLGVGLIANHIRVLFLAYSNIGGVLDKRNTGCKAGCNTARKAGAI